MNPQKYTPPLLDRRLAVLLQYGTWVACTVIAAGLMLDAAARTGMLDAIHARWSAYVVTAGVGLFVLLPILRVTLMLAIFAQQRNRRYVMIAATVLAIIAVGCVLGIRLGPVGG
ncbi:DUF1634 domain-containing protein [Paraburkholderia humisilvae]|uniref:DUF1634 domain-containing protein n=1 Tax=Paraburkholderia humisilvae TaxID=627669 RepID=A0A6J5DGD7_9BURK|nr:DUF1634 domain-containing protein [Paraburkholderia humisilvae]CAB3752514.1 hypothetical protein LMG29542_01787 [Paraburkholderia humisilvae]